MGANGIRMCIAKGVIDMARIVLTGQEDYEALSNEPTFSALVKEWKVYRLIGTVEDFKRLVTAQNEGRLVELPCKVGDNIYWINDEENCVSVHKNGIKGIVVRNGGFAIEDTDGYIDIAGTKYCYLTREEAESALAKEDTENDK